MPSSLSRAVIATEPASYTAGGFQASPPPAVAGCTARCGALPSGLAFRLACRGGLPGEVIDCFKVDLADSDQRHGVDLVEIDWRRNEQPWQSGIGQSLHQLVGRLVERGMDDHQALASGFIRQGGDHGAPSSLPPVSVTNASSIAANGTCSPPILAKRLWRPTMVMNPSSSTVTTSPVLYQPSWRTASDKSCWFK